MGRWRKSSSASDGQVTDVGLNLQSGESVVCGEQPRKEMVSERPADVLGLPLVCEELTKLLKEHQILLLSRSAGLLSPHARYVLKSHGINLKAFLEAYRSEFNVEVRHGAVYVSLAPVEAGRLADNCAIADTSVLGLGRRWGKQIEMQSHCEVADRIPCYSERTMRRSARRQKQRQRAREERHLHETYSKNTSDEVCIVWLRDDLRLHDNPALSAAANSGRAIIPVFIHDTTDPSPWPVVGAGLWWKHQSLEAFARSLRERCHSNLIIRSGAAIQVLHSLCEEVGASHVYFNRQVEPWYRERDLTIEEALAGRAVTVESFKAVVLAEPWERHCIETAPEQPVAREGNPVHLRALIDHARPKGLYEKDEIVAHQDDGRVAPDCLPLPSVAGCHLRRPSDWPSSIPLSSLGYGYTVGFGYPKDFKQFRGPSELQKEAESPEFSARRSSKDNWAARMTKEWHVGEDAALKRLREFVDSVLQSGLHDSAPHRCRADERWTSVLSPHIRFGELSPRTCYAEALKCNLNRRKPFVRRLLWRDLAYAELFRWPDLPTMSVRKQYESQKWTGSQTQLKRWQRGQTGFPLVDAGMRQLWKIGWLPNYMRHVTAQFLIDYLDISWKEGFRWYDFTLLDADVAINAHMWQNGGHSGVSQWYFLLHPVAAAERADPHGHYVRRWVPELAGLPDEFIHCPWDAPLGLHSISLLNCHHEYCDRVIKDLAAAVRRHVCQVIALRQANMNLVNKQGYDMLQLPTGRHIRLGTRDDFRLFDVAQYLTPLFSTPRHRIQQSLLRPSVVGVQNALLEEEARRRNGSYGSTTAELDNLL